MDDLGIRRIAVIGGGLIGQGVAVQFAQAGYPVGLFNRTDESRQRALATMRFDLQVQVDHGLTTAAAAAAALARIRAETDVARAAEGADFVVEAVSEDLGLKQAIFQQIDELCPAPAILSSDTSGLSITEIAAVTKRPDRVIGTHHFNPPPLVPGVEVVPGDLTSQDTIDRTVALLRQVGKQPAVVKNVPGFVAARLSTVLRREAWALVEQGIATPEAVDIVWRTTVGRVFGTVGPLEVTDTTGIDVALAVHGYLEPLLAQPSTPPAIIREKFARGEYGVKTGKGFYEWTPERVAALKRRRDGMLAAMRRQDNVGEQQGIK